ncbi:hypothetical protein [uncultured Cyclobacterium sp.]|uniref:hypothetical protein n=1 Tax=uncultured Cyclobacterium sp. TaxID=453820 RepID=UPI0030EC44B8|tara:strand:+ start:5717 stop:5947 length:231 start_codon:yes stop_codon:yes gene_type:complete
MKKGKYIFWNFGIGCGFRDSKYSLPDNFILHFSGLSDGLLPITPLVDESHGILGYGFVKINFLSLSQKLHFLINQY